MPRTSSSVEYSEMIGAVLRARRIEAGLTQAQVGERLDVGQSYINRVETGRINMTIGQLGRLCEALDATLRVRLDVPERDPLLDRMLERGGRRAGSPSPRPPDAAAASRRVRKSCGLSGGMRAGALNCVSCLGSVSM